MDLIECILIALIILPMMAPAFLSIAFLIGWHRNRHIRAEAFAYLEARGKELQEKFLIEEERRARCNSV